MSAIVVLGVFVADASFRADRQAAPGETLLGNSFALGPGGKGSNQAVAAAKAGGDARMLTKLGRDTFADMALALWQSCGVTPDIIYDADSYTGAAGIFVDEASGENAIIICPGVGSTITAADIEHWAPALRGAEVFVTQLEQPVPAAHRALQIARDGNARIILNPAPAGVIPDNMLRLCDFLTPNETEAMALTGIAVNSLADAERAADALLAKGAGGAMITLGENGAYFKDQNTGIHIPAFNAGPVVETTGAGDAFNGGFAAELARGADPIEAARYGAAAAAISVTRPGTAPSMPGSDEISALLDSAK